MNQNFNDGYEIYGQENAPRTEYKPMSYEEAVEQRSHHKHYQSKLNYNFPMLEKAAGIFKIVSALFMVLFAVFFILGCVTHGGIFLLAKTEATVTEVEKHSVYVSSFEGNHMETHYEMTLNYDYKDKNYTMYATSNYDKGTGSTVYVYINKLSPYTVWYIDGFGTIIKIVAIAMSICGFLLVSSITLENYGRNQLMRDYDPEYGRSKYYPQPSDRYDLF